MRDGPVRRYVAVLALALAAAGCAADATNDHTQEAAVVGGHESTFERVIRGFLASGYQLRAPTTTMVPATATLATTGAITATTHPWPPESAVMASEVVVGLAISRFAPAWQNCHVGYRYAPLVDEIRDLGTGPAGDPHAWHREVEFVCEFQVDFNKADDDEYGVTLELVVRYPLRAVVDELDAEINGHVRSAVAAIVSDYFTAAQGRRESTVLTGSPRYGDHRTGWLHIDGAATLANDGIYSVELPSHARDPGATTSPSYLRTLNYDLHTGQQFFLTDLVEDRVDARAALFRAADEATPNRDLSAWPIDVDLADLREQEFSLTEDSIVLRCIRYCDKGIAPVLFLPGPSKIEVSYTRLEGHLDPGGPYRHIDDRIDP